MSEKEIFSRLDLAEILGMDLTEVDRLLREDNLPHIIIGDGKVLVLRSSLVRWLKSRELPVKVAEPVTKSGLKITYEADKQPVKLVSPKGFGVSVE